MNYSVKTTSEWLATPVLGLIELGDECINNQIYS